VGAIFKFDFYLELPIKLHETLYCLIKPQILFTKKL